MSKTTIIIDGYGFIFRAYHSLPPLTTVEAIPVGAVFGFTSMLLKVLADFKPNHAVVVFDSGKKTFRHELYPAYKMNRPDAPEDLKIQFPICREAAHALNFKIIEKVGFEADDIIATLARTVVENKEKAIIISSDKDLMQLITDDIVMFDSLKNKYITKTEVYEKFGVTPEKVRDVLAIMGDSSDNIPGINGIGPKGATELIQKYGSLEGLLAHSHEITQPKRKQSIIDCHDQALLSKKLITLDTHVPLEITLNDLEQTKPEVSQLLSFLNKYGFKSIITKATKFFDMELTSAVLELNSPIKQAIAPVIIKNIDQLKSNLQASVITGKLAINFIKSADDIIGVSFTNDGINSFYLNIDKSISLDLFSSQDSSITFSIIVNILKPYLEDMSILKIIYNLKDTLKIIKTAGISLHPCGCEDIMLMHYAMNVGNASSDLYHIINQYFSHLNIQGVTNLLQVSKVKTLGGLNNEVLSDHFGQIVIILFELYHQFKQDLKQENAITIYKEIDLPLTFVLDEIENYGVKIDPEKLAGLSKTFEHEIKDLEAKIFKIAGQEFNIGSPKQLGDVLFESMGLPSGKTSSKSGGYSTSADVLETLSESGVEIADYILKWRQLSKLKNTYTDSLPKQINPITGRIHTTFLQASTNTGRLSSQDPNLQNIPIRTELGESIRAAFIVQKGFKLISADYSQIELRLLSHMANIGSLQDAFRHGKDIHRETACQVFKIPASEVTSDIRRKAKAINFGIIYGISAFGLAKQLGINRQQAALYIEAYFKEYPGIEQYMENMKQYARKHGFVKSLFGRKCFIKYINDKNFSLRSFSERAAINAPLQGTTADIAKVAMIKVNHLLKTKNFKTRMLIQVHDELLFEAPENEVEVLMPLIKNTMQSVLSLSVPLVVDIKAGNNWAEVH